MSGGDLQTNKQPGIALNVTIKYKAPAWKESWAVYHFSERLRKPACMHSRWLASSSNRDELPGNAPTLQGSNHQRPDSTTKKTNNRDTIFLCNAVRILTAVSTAVTRGASMCRGVLLVAFERSSAPWAPRVIRTWFLHPLYSRFFAATAASSTDLTGSPLVISAWIFRSN